MNIEIKIEASSVEEVEAVVAKLFKGGATAKEVAVTAEPEPEKTTKPRKTKEVKEEAVAPSVEQPLVTDPLGADPLASTVTANPLGADPLAANTTVVTPDPLTASTPTQEKPKELTLEILRHAIAKSSDKDACRATMANYKDKNGQPVTKVPDLLEKDYQAFYDDISML